MTSWRSTEVCLSVCLALVARLSIAVSTSLVRSASIFSHVGLDHLFEGDIAVKVRKKRMTDVIFFLKKMYFKSESKSKAHIDDFKCVA